MRLTIIDKCINMLHMKVDGRELQAIQNELGISPEQVCSEADLSITTLYKVYGNKRVGRSSADRVRKALNTLRTKSKATA